MLLTGALAPTATFVRAALSRRGASALGQAAITRWAAHAARDASRTCEVIPLRRGIKVRRSTMSVEDVRLEGAMYQPYNARDAARCADPPCGTHSLVLG